MQHAADFCCCSELTSAGSCRLCLSLWSKNDFKQVRIRDVVVDDVQGAFPIRLSECVCVCQSECVRLHLHMQNI